MTPALTTPPARHTAPTSRMTGVLVVLASIMAAYFPPVVIVARDARMRDQLAADMADAR